MKTNIKRGAVLIVDDNEEFLIALRLMLMPHFKQVSTEKNPALLPSLLGKFTFDLIILDMNFKAGLNTGNEGIFWLNEIRKIDGDVPVIFITAFGDVQLAVRSVKEGAIDFIQKSWEEAKILSTVLTAFELGNSKREIQKMKSRQEHLSDALDNQYQLCKGSSEAMNEVYNLIDKVAKTDANILITGENGTGKEVLAREIHRKSERSNGLFIAVDMAAIPVNLIESELFGHKKGAFTDAREDRTGRFELASGGTLFLDEVGNLDHAVQKKLLQVLQERIVYRLGDSQPRSVDIRLICATNAALNEMVNTGEFREDLLYRINTIHIEVPPLRKRIEDIPDLADFFLHKYAEKYDKKQLEFGAAAINKLKTSPWHGNIRELEHAIEKAVILTSDKKISADIFSFEQITTVKRSEIENFNLADHEKQLIRKALDQFNWNMSKTAKELGINRSTLYDKIKKYEL
jgi:DNA-binding NtrC family response regulator